MACEIRGTGSHSHHQHCERTSTTTTSASTTYTTHTSTRTSVGTTPHTGLPDASATCSHLPVSPTALERWILKMIDVLRMAFQISFLIEMLWNNGTGSPHHRIVNLIYLCHPRSPHHVPTPHPRCQRHLPPPHPRGCVAGQRGTVSSVGCPVDSAITPLSHTHTNLPTRLYPFQNTLKSINSNRIHTNGPTQL